MFAFYVTGASVRVWMGNEAPFCFFPLPPLAKVFYSRFSGALWHGSQTGGAGKKNKTEWLLLSRLFFKKKEWRLEATSSFVHYGEKAPGRDEEGEKRWRLGKKLQLSLSLPLSPRVYRRRRRRFPHFWPSPLPLSSSSSSLHFFFSPSLKRRGCKSSLFLPPLFLFSQAPKKAPTSPFHARPSPHFLLQGKRFAHIVAVKKSVLGKKSSLFNFEHKW